MRQGLARRLDRLAMHHGAVTVPRLVIVFEEIDDCRRTMQPAAQETTSEARQGITVEHRREPTVVVFRERADGPL